MKQEKENKKAIDQLAEAFMQIQTKEEAQLFLKDLCTPVEIEAMADRWLVIPLIKQGKSYRSIYEKTGVSVTTIGRVARALMQGTGGYNLIYSRINKENKEK